MKNNTTRIFYSILLIAFAISIFTSCSFQKTAEKFVDKNKDSFAREFINDIVEGDTLLFQKMDQSVINENSDKIFNRIHEIVNKQRHKSIKIIGLRKHLSTDDIPTTSINYQYEYERVYLLFTVTVSKKNKSYVVKGFYADANREPFTKNLDFSFRGKQLIHYTVLLFAISLLLFLVTTIVVLVKTPIKRKWLWAIFILICNIGFEFNWTTGAFNWRNIKFVILGAGIEQGNVYEPWQFSLALPLGAIWFWIKRNKLKREKREYEELIAMYADKTEDKMEENTIE